MKTLGDDKELSRYTNFGVFDYPDRAEALKLNLDTWYYQDGEVVGVMNLEDGPTSFEGGVVEYVWHQLDAFLSAFDAIADVHGPVHVSGRPIGTGRGGTWRGIEISEREVFVRDLERFVLDARVSIGHVFVWLDGRIVVRDSKGSLREHVVPEIGRLWLSAHADRSAFSETPRSFDLVPWTATLQLDYVSVFRRDNHLILDRMREHWRRLRASDPSLTWDNDEQPKMPLIVTLAAVPEKTPRTNDILYRLNAPRLIDSIHQWEMAAGRMFSWHTVLADTASE